jgi:hypothetical protein
MKEQLIINFKLPMINNLSLVNVIVRHGYKLTGNKFSIDFNGSKGYLSHIEISCEGSQKERNNIIWIEDLRTKKGTLKSKSVKIYHSEINGIRIEI